MYKIDGEWQYHEFGCTTDPGSAYMDNPILENTGCAILKPNQYNEVGNENNDVDYNRINVIDLIQNVDLVINIPQKNSIGRKTDGYLIRRSAIDNSIPLMTNIKNTKLIDK